MPMALELASASNINISGLVDPDKTIIHKHTQGEIMSLTPFEIRLELLKMAKDMLVDEYHSKRDTTSQDWQIKVENARHAGAQPPEHPQLPSYPSETDIIIKAQTLNGFVSNIPLDTAKKSKV
jgi:hypothetical protein